MRAAPLLALTLLSGCGSLLRAEAGPTWIEDRGVGGTVQLTAGLPIIAGTGIADVLVVGGSATLVEGEVFAGLVFGCDLVVAPGGVDQPRGPERRDGLGGALRFHPRLDEDGLALGGGLGAVYGRGEREPGGDVSFGSGKSALGVSWDRRRYLNVGAAVDAQYRQADDRRPGRLRLDAFALFERLVVTD